MFEQCIDLTADQAGLISQITECELAKARLAADQAELTAALIAQRDAAELAAKVAADKRRRGLGSEVALARRESPYRGNQRMGFALALVHEMPHTLAALQAGAVNEWRATLVVRETAFLTVEDRRALDAELCADQSRLASWGDARLTSEAKKIAYRLDPQGAVDRAAKAHTERHVRVRPTPENMTYLSALLPMTHGVAVYAALKKAADTAVDERTHSQVMADTLVERVTGRPAETPVPVAVGLLIDDEALLAGGDAPAIVDGYGPIPAEIGRRMVEDALADENSRVTLRRLFRHPRSGAMIGMESASRRFPPGLAAMIRHRDQICRTPYCNAPIRHIDHAEPHRNGGKTSARNGNGLCAQCNYAKEADGWTTVGTIGPDGTHTTDITTPTGHTHRSQAPPLPG